MPSTYHYGPDPSHVADLWLPDTEGPHPVVVLIHGGFWREPYRRDLMDALANDLSARGFAAWNLEYRRVGRSGGGWPATLSDVAAGIDHLRGLDHVDADDLTTVGHSAGAQLALWAAARRRLTDGDPGSHPVVQPTAAVSLSGVLDLEAGARQDLGGGAIEAFLGGSPDEHPNRYRVASPASLVPIGVPQLLVHPPRDTIVGVSGARAYARRARAYARRARAAGDEVALEEPDGDHFTVIDPSSAAWQGVCSWLETRAQGRSR